MRLYVAYNAWFRQVTGAENDREGIEALKMRFVIWYDYQQGLALKDLRPLVFNIINLLEDRPCLRLTLSDADDYKNLIEYWYQVRCHLFHGSSAYLTDDVIELAYKSLSVFMAEIVARMNLSFTEKDSERLEEITALIRYDPTIGPRLQTLQQSLQQKYINSPDIWNVDMLPAQSYYLI